MEKELFEECSAERSMEDGRNSQKKRTGTRENSTFLGREKRLEHCFATLTKKERNGDFAVSGSEKALKNEGNGGRGPIEKSLLGIPIVRKSAIRTSAQEMKEERIGGG